MPQLVTGQQPATVEQAAAPQRDISPSHPPCHHHRLQKRARYSAQVRIAYVLGVLVCSRSACACSCNRVRSSASFRTPPALLSAANAAQSAASAQSVRNRCSLRATCGLPSRVRRSCRIRTPLALLSAAVAAQSAAADAQSAAAAQSIRTRCSRPPAARNRVAAARSLHSGRRLQPFPRLSAAAAAQSAAADAQPRSPSRGIVIALAACGLPPRSVVASGFLSAGRLRLRPPPRRRSPLQPSRSPL